MTLEATQKAKHKFIANSLKIGEGSKVLNIACGWGHFQNTLLMKEVPQALA
jgi:cyclopropane-fatty-acyl-phospholipid synthase